MNVQPESSHLPFMHAALEQARLSAAHGEVPIGAVLVSADGQILGLGHNSPIGGHDPTAHAEVMALRQAAARLGNYRLEGCTLYVTLEPCTMCAGAVLNARLAALVYAVAEPRTGAAGSVLNAFALPQINHQTRVHSGAALGPDGQAWARDCAALLQDFFRDRRQQARQAQQRAMPVRDDALRTAANRWQGRGWPMADSRFTNTLPALAGLRLHYLDASRPDGAGLPSPGGPARSVAGLSWLLLHGHPGWSAGYATVRELLLALPQTGRVVVPDLPGFGLSDKPKKSSTHQPHWHLTLLAELIEQLDLRRLVLVGHGVGADLAQALAAKLEKQVAGLWLLPQGAAANGAGWAADAAELQQLSTRTLDQSIARADRWCGRGRTPAALLGTPWPDVGHQAAFRAIADWYRDRAAGAAGAEHANWPGPGAGRVAPTLVGWQAEPTADGRREQGALASVDPQRRLWAQPDDELDADTLARAAAYFGPGH